ncbi:MULTISPECIES: glycosyltransferase family 2 protein [Fusobacterium]|jgi:glycosyltransferase involved in cell wall biosynthesis|uniref:Glycosyltransferase family 2 protein n=1 Tax=Fusobacterium varium ATCC 27725 TaxID=469618 RepID=A0ABN5JEF8_FUSVA|nr:MULTISPECIES: glycosyltransferase family 2 protein [Fusobacterium]AVQ30471.1 glycosyltransferase family 2 protein [Fusobacterium varium ATCC 27725]EES64097.1 glycosyltransferase, group 2 family protein [Fusobacterium varium ATCC 27725]MCF0169067.1 glycosyltransferase family 2 protein [Fusobacterium varium]MCF2672257.1 glycosyltransferase family 2 protein [Fusobacterium varium]MCI6032644.1 glycosyltransferase family 2 protein [Fusobacterium varium]
MKLSAAIMTFNEERNLERTLKALADICDEIVIVDSGSTDKTKEIAEKYEARFIYQPWLGYGKQRNAAIDNCSGKWILAVDADEELSPELKQKITEIINGNEDKKVYEINRLSVCFGKKIKHGGWGTSYAVRLFLKTAGRFNDNTVHESFVTQEEIFKIKENIYHHSYLTLEDYFSKFNRYTTEGALEYYKKGKKASIGQVVFNPMYKFIRMYIIRLGFLDGIEGFLLASTSSMYSMVKYFKLREIYKNGSYRSKKN